MTTPNLEFYELSGLSSGEAMRLFDLLRNERGQVVSVTRQASGDVIVVTPFDTGTTRRLLAEVAGQISDVSVH